MEEWTGLEKYLFLSDEWTVEAKRLHDEIAGDVGPPGQGVRMNLVLTSVPFGDGSIDAHLDTTAGDLTLEKGHLDDAALKVTVDYETAKQILVEGNTQAAMQAFMAGRIKVDGDMSMLLTLGSGPVDPAHQELALAIREITE